MGFFDLFKTADEWIHKEAVLIRDLGKYQEAIECFDKALATNPKHEEAWIPIGKNYS